MSNSLAIINRVAADRGNMCRQPGGRVGRVRRREELMMKASEVAAVERLTYRIRDIAAVLGVSRRTIEAERSAGRLPEPDLRIGKVPLWRVETIRAWLARGTTA